MQPWWKDDSPLASYLEAQRSLRSARTPLTPTYHGALSEVRNEDMMRLERVYSSLQNVQHQIFHCDEHLRWVIDLLAFVSKLREDLPLSSPEEAFERLLPLRTWLFWLPPAMLRGQDSDLISLAVLSQFFSVALALEPLFPEIGGAYLGTMSVPPIEEMQRMFYARKATQSFTPDAQIATSIMELPGEMVVEYKDRLQWSSQHVDPYHSNPHSPYSTFQNVQLVSSASDTPGLSSTYGTSPMRSPAHLAVPSSPYHAAAAGMGSRRQSQYLDPSPPLHSEYAEDRNLTAFTTLGDSPAYSPAFTPSELLGMGYQSQAPSYSYGSSGGFVASASELCWT